MTSLTAIITALGLLFLFVIGILTGKALSKNQIKQVLNTDRKFGSSKYYYLISTHWDGKKVDLLLTENDLKELKQRALNNLEDLK